MPQHITSHIEYNMSVADIAIMFANAKVAGPSIGIMLSDLADMELHYDATIFTPITNIDDQESLIFVPANGDACRGAIISVRHPDLAGLVWNIRSSSTAIDEHMHKPEVYYGETQKHDAAGPMDLAEALLNE